MNVDIHSATNTSLGRWLREMGYYMHGRECESSIFRSVKTRGGWGRVSSSIVVIAPRWA